MVLPVGPPIESSGWIATESAAVVKLIPSFTDSICVGAVPQFFPMLESPNCQIAPLLSARVEIVLELTGLVSIRDRFVSELSKGQKQRVQLARVLLHDPEVLVLDEPASDLDPRARVELRELVQLLRRDGKTILLSSHILSELADVCTHIGILDRGRIVAAGPIDRVTEEAMRGPRAPDGAYRASSAPDRRAATLRVIGERDRILAALGTVPHVADVALSHLGRVTLSYTGDERVLGAAVKALVNADVLVCAVEPHEHDLERVFLQLTGQVAS